MMTRLLTREIRDSRKSILLLSTRQVGKSTLIGGLGPDLEINFPDAWSTSIWGHWSPQS
jgi:predicted AAA+ superfamily ATPase